MVAVGGWPQPRQRWRIDGSRRRTGSVLQWSRHFGWIAPDDEIEHPEAHKHNWRVYVNLRDVASGQPLQGGACVSFFAYCDGNGIGAEDVRLESKGCDDWGQGAQEVPEWWSGANGEGGDACDQDSCSRPAKRQKAMRIAGKGGVTAAIPKSIETPASASTPAVSSPSLFGGVPAAKMKGRGKGRKGKDSCGKRSPSPTGCARGGGPDRTQTSQSDSAAVLSWASSELRGWRPAMEDACVAILGLAGPLEWHAMFGVFDGHGGHIVSRRAADDLPDEVVAAALRDCETLGDSAPSGRPSPPPCERGEEPDGGLAGRALRTALPTLDSAIRESGADQLGFLPASSGGGPIPSDVRNAYALMGSTACVALLECDGPPKIGRPLRAVVANCGDSRALLCRRGECVELSEDHKPDDPVERGRIEKAGGFVATVGPCQRIDGWGLNLSRALGDFHYKARDDLPPEDQKVSVIPDIRYCDITEEDEFLLLGCDGVFELHSSQEAVDHVRQQLLDGATPTEAVRSLVDACCSYDLLATQGKGSDNVTAMVVLLR